MQIIPFQGTRNFRDMGGYQTVDGRKVKRGLFFRSDELTALSKQELVEVQALKIKTIVDYRDASEVRHKPDPNIAGIMRLHLPAVPETQASQINLPGYLDKQKRSSHYILDLVQSGFFERFRAEDLLLELYSKLAINNPSYKRLMELIRLPDRLGLLHHCRAGKDRTGVGSALILLALGVPEATIMEDYLLTNEIMKTYNNEQLHLLSQNLNETELRNVEQMLFVKEAFMEAVFQSIKQTYGSIDVYLSIEFGLGQGEREVLQEICLE
ncbi:C4-dicarboxylate ABC transporter [Paenibacillus glycanilyticus]|uniref:C4-dicarboxylate ABC transporter n=1 Tax=Paenibacillus glycanilyticus TaxID=126569 RepID=A0ABQ6NTJ6_9BACL|nr:tyrosine-protein phosphatase [Paenibacillus glycanilyticus]GMK47447.1 C4-dicarboxylate ABC transporter [Paenibacillus glycanilyticus]